MHRELDDNGAAPTRSSTCHPCAHHALGDPRTVQQSVGFPAWSCHSRARLAAVAGHYPGHVPDHGADGVARAPPASRAARAAAWPHRHRRAGVIDHTAALTALERALRLAEPEGYVRLFADLGLAMARLLQEARSRALLPDYVAQILAAVGEHPVTTAPAGARLPEPLTPRELDVVRLVAAGLTNREIGEQLVISVETVKRHVSNVCDKLGVGNRTEAAARARDLDLLT